MKLSVSACNFYTAGRFVASLDFTVSFLVLHLLPSVDSVPPRFLQGTHSLPVTLFFLNSKNPGSLLTSTHLLLFSLGCVSQPLWSVHSSPTSFDHVHIYNSIILLLLQQHTLHSYGISQGGSLASVIYEPAAQAFNLTRPDLCTNFPGALETSTS